MKLFYTELSGQEVYWIQPDHIQTKAGKQLNVQWGLQTSSLNQNGTAPWISTKSLPVCNYKLPDCRDRERGTMEHSPS